MVCKRKETHPIVPNGSCYLYFVSSLADLDISAQIQDVSTSVHVVSCQLGGQHAAIQARFSCEKCIVALLGLATGTTCLTFRELVFAQIAWAIVVLTLVSGPPRWIVQPAVDTITALDICNHGHQVPMSSCLSSWPRPSLVRCASNRLQGFTNSPDRLRCSPATTANEPRPQFPPSSCLVLQ